MSNDFNVKKINENYSKIYNRMVINPIPNKIDVQIDNQPQKETTTHIPNDNVVDLLDSLESLLGKISTNIHQGNDLVADELIVSSQDIIHRIKANLPYSVWAETISKYK